MRIFIGSSNEQSVVMNRVSAWLRKCHHHPLPWNRAIKAGEPVLIDQLIRISHEVDGAIFIFAEDDKVVGRAKKRQTRDNVIFEFGLFMGALGAKSVIFLRVGRPDIASDLQGVVYINLQSAKLDARAKDAIADWASRLAPLYIKGLGFDIADYLQWMLTRRKDVAGILGEVAPKLAQENRSNEIRALCSDKGDYGNSYYKMQFDWVAKKRGRCIKRIFVRSKEDDYGFSASETTGMLMHLDQPASRVEIRWIYSDSLSSNGLYPSFLGFAIFGKSWLVHWGLVSGTFHDASQGTDYGALRLIENRFKTLWSAARAFDDELVDRIRQRQEVGS